MALSAARYGDGHGTLQEGSLFSALAEDLKTPLLRIAYQAEVADSSDIQSTAVDALRLIDAYLLSTKSQTQFELEPVNPDAVLVDVAHELSKHARRFDCELQLNTHPRHGAALLHRQALTSALTAIGMVFIEAQGIVGGKRIIQIAAYRTSKGISVGLFQTEGFNSINAQLLSRAFTHVGVAARPFAGLASGAAAHLFVAEHLLIGMQSSLRAAKRGGLFGLAADLLPSSQLQLV